jgi:hypothetical protein
MRFRLVGWVAHELMARSAVGQARRPTSERGALYFYHALFKLRLWPIRVRHQKGNMDHLSTRVGITPDVVDRIAAVEDPVLRNALITQCYHELSVAFAAATGPCANWCSFATWASKQAGVTIRSEDLRAALDRELDHAPAVRSAISLLAAAARLGGVRLAIPEVRAAVRRAVDPEATARRASEAVARGNRKVFEEIGKEFAQFLAALPQTPADHQLADGFVQRLRPGPPPHGQDLLRRAFRRYHVSLSADAATAAQTRFLANLEIGLHEQTRLQPEIFESLNAPLATARDLRERLLSVFSGNRFWTTLVSSPAGALLTAVVSPLRRFAERLSREVITERLMVLQLPDGTALRLAEPLTEPIPAALCAPVNPAFVELRARFERCAGGAMTGVTDWSDLDERMHFILHLFCAFHTRDDLRSAPFSDVQARAIAGGRIPEGLL